MPASMQRHTSTSYSGGKDKSLALALEQAKVKVRQMVKKRNQEEANIDSEPLYPTFKKSRVVPKSSGVLTESTVSSRRLEGDGTGTDVDSKKKIDIFAADLDDASHRVGTNAEVATSESQKNDAEPTETSKTKKSLPFIGKLPFLKAARAAKQAASDPSAADDKSKIEIKLNAGTTISTPVISEPALSSPDVVSTSAQEQAVPKWSVSVPRSNMESMSIVEQNSLDAFLSIGDPESGQSQAVPVLNVGPQTRSEFMLENQPDGIQTSPAMAKASTSLSTATASKDVPAVQSGSDVALVPSPAIDVKAVVMGVVMGDVQQSGAVSTSNQSDAVSVHISSTSTVQQTKDTQISPVSGPHDVNSSSILAAADTDCNTDPSHIVENDSEVFVDVDDNTEDYEAENSDETGQVALLPRDEEIAKVLPQTSATWMEPAASGSNTFFVQNKLDLP